MKYLLIGIMLSVSASLALASEIGHKAEAMYVQETDSVTLEQLVAMDKKQFRGKTIAEFLESEEAKGYTELLFRHNNQGLLEGLKVKYSDELYLTVYVDKFRKLEPFNPDNSWSMEDLKQEQIREIRVVYVMHE